MADQSTTGKQKGEEAVVGVKGDVKSLQQLSSSGQAARRKREENHVDRGMGAIGEAIQSELGEASSNKGKSGK